MTGPRMFPGGPMSEVMRSGPYVMSVFALAELIDNSVDAEAKHIDILCKSRINHQTGRAYLEEVAVADDGVGMTRDELMNALVMASTTRRGPKGETKGIGKFGMGLPNSSITQCKRVTVYSWRKKGEVFSTYADMDEIKSSNDDHLPEPPRAAIPEHWKGMSTTLDGKSGTLVVWSSLDKFDWQRFSAFFKNSEHFIGRIYRRYIENGQIEINMVDFNQDNHEKTTRTFHVNDPLYLTVPSSTPEPWNNTAMFEPYGEHWEREYSISGHAVKVRYTMVKKDVRPADQTGRMPFGKHAARNIGISLMRGERELVLDTTISDGDTRERWWGIEVEFPPALDEIFGVTYYKQGAHHFSRMVRKYLARADDMEEKRSDDSEDDEFYDFVRNICKMKGQMRDRIKNMKIDTRKQPRASNGINTRYDVRGTKTEKQGTQTTKTREKEIAKALEPDVFPKPEAEKEAERLASDDELKVVFYSRKLAGDRILFETDFAGTKVIIKLNMNHPAYQNMISLVEDIPETIGLDDARATLSKIHFGFKCLFAAWANMEDKEENHDLEIELQNVRYYWGNELARFMKSK